MNAVHNSTFAIAQVMAQMDRQNQSLSKNVGTMIATSDSALEKVLEQGKPGNWASDHRAEASRFTGWQYVAINAIAKACQMCEVNAYGFPSRERFGKSYNIQDDKGEPFDVESPLMKFLKRPNPKQSGASFRYEEALQN